MALQSLDPRVNRLELPEEIKESFETPGELDQWQTYQVFHQSNRGEQHKHVGIVHAPNPEMALLFAKEQYARRMKCVNLWVVKTADVYQTEYEDSDMFEPATDKSYRESFGYKDTRTLIDRYIKATKGVSLSQKAEEIDATANKAEEQSTSSKTTKKPAIIIGGKK